MGGRRCSSGTAGTNGELPRLSAALGVAALALAGCGDWHQGEGLTEADRQLIRFMVLPAEPSPDPTNRFSLSPEAAQLGQALFFDAELSSPAGMSCADCHDPQAWFIDTHAPNNVSQGVQPLSGARPFTKRNSPSLVNVAHYRWWPWDGRSDSLWMQCAVAYESERTMFGTRSRLVRRMVEKYSPALNQLGIFIGPKDLVDDRAAEEAAASGYKVIAAYLERLSSTNAPFDRFAAGDEVALSAEAKRGLQLFIGKAGCIECHNGPALNGAAFARSEVDFYASVGVGQRGANVPSVDLGRWDGLAVLTDRMKGAGVYSSAGQYNDAARAGLKFDRVGTIVRREEDKGQFRIKSLRQVAQTAPYMHAGQLATLADVVHFYNTGGDPGGFAGQRDRALQPLGLTNDEELDLVAFLESLTGDPLPFGLTCDRSASAPRKPYLPCDGSTQ